MSAQHTETTSARVYSPGQLAAYLGAIEANDTKYEPRYGLVLEAVALAHRLGYPAGFRIDPAEPEWPVAFIELPMEDGTHAQVSWHMPQHPIPYDGHTTSEKYARIDQWIRATLT